MAGPLPISQLSIKTDGYDLTTGSKNVASAGTAEAIANTALFCFQVLLQAKQSNTGRIYVGPSTVANNDTNGIYLDAGDIMQLNNQDLADIYIDAGVSGEGVTYLGWK